MITTEQIKKLRDETGISVMQCKKSLEDAGGDMEKALLILRRKSAEQVAKKSDRELKAGAVSAYVHVSKTVGAMVLLSCETDFVARNEEFQKLAYDISMHVAAMKPEYLSMADVQPATVDKLKEVFMPETEGKPEEIREKILSGKVESYLKERVLLCQPFIKDSNRTINDLIASAVQKFGERIEIAKYFYLTV